jgi:hypothetical protein
MRSQRALAAAFLLSALVLAGCGGGTSRAANGGSATDVGSAEESAAPTAPYAALPAESANEKQAAESVDIALKAFAESKKRSAAPKGAAPYAFENNEGYEPFFIGHQIALLTGRQKNGTYGMAQVVVLGDKVTTQAQWEKSEGITKDNGLMDLEAFKVELPTDPQSFEKPLKPSSSAEKNAVSLASDWMANNVSELGFKDAILIGYVFAYGQPGDRPNLVISISPDGASYSGRQEAPN